MTTTKTELHPRNPHRGHYDFKKLIDECVDNVEEIVVDNSYKQNNEIF